MPKVTFQQTVHTFQIDINRHVSNIVYVQWLEIGRTRLLEAAGLNVEAMHERGIHAILVETTIKHREPLFFPDTVTIEVWISELTHVSAWMDFRILSGKTGKVAATARQRGVFVDAKTSRPHRLEDDERAAFEKVLSL